MVMDLFWKYMEEYGGGLTCVEFEYKDQTYQLVYDNDEKYYVYTIEGNCTEVLGVYETLDGAFDGIVAEGLSMREIFNQIEEKDFTWL